MFVLIRDDVVGELFSLAAIADSVACLGRLLETVTRFAVDFLATALDDCRSWYDDKELPLIAVRVDGTRTLPRCQARQLDIEWMALISIPQRDGDVLPVSGVATAFPRPLLVLFFDIVCVYDPVCQVTSMLCV